MVDVMKEFVKLEAENMENSVYARVDEIIRRVAGMNSMDTYALSFVLMNGDDLVIGKVMDDTGRVLASFDVGGLFLASLKQAYTNRDFGAKCGHLLCERLDNGQLEEMAREKLGHNHLLMEYKRGELCTFLVSADDFIEVSLRDYFSTVKLFEE